MERFSVGIVPLRWHGCVSVAMQDFACFNVALCVVALSLFFGGLRDLSFSFSLCFDCSFRVLVPAGQIGVGRLHAAGGKERCELQVRFAGDHEPRGSFAA